MASIIGVETLQHTNGTTAATIDSSGRIFQPAKPMFSAKGKTSGAAYVQTSPIVFPNEEFDVGGMYNTSTGVVTIPVDGKYRFHVSVFVKGDAGENSQVVFQTSTDGGSNYTTVYNGYQKLTGGTQMQVPTSYTLMLDLNANDLARLTFSGTAEYYNSNNYMVFSGEFLG